MVYFLAAWVAAISLGFYKGERKPGGSCGEEFFTPRIGSLAGILTGCLMFFWGGY